MPYWKLSYHFVWGTKNRFPLIDSVLEPELYRAIAAKAQKLGGFVHAIGGIEGIIRPTIIRRATPTKTAEAASPTASPL